MSATLAGGSQRTRKATCGKCQRTVYVVTIDGETAFVDPELISVVPFEVQPPSKIAARRSHSEMCTNYRSEAEKKKTLALMRRHAKGSK